MESDTVQIGSVGAEIQRRTTTAESFKNTSNGRDQRGQLPAFSAANIRATHFKINPGGPSTTSEAQNSFGQVKT
jgi:hypothetical protein